MKLTTLILMVASLLLVSCGKKHDSAKKQMDVAPNVITPEEAELVMQNQSFLCASIDGRPCPLGLVRLMILDEVNRSRVSYCSGFLVAPNQIVTNHHCVASEVNCENTFMSIYDGGANVYSRCSRIVGSLAQTDPNGIDYAVLELDRPVTHIAPYRLAQASGTSSVATAWVVDYQDGLRSRISQFDCKSIPDGNPDSLILENCPIIHGNSGSPVLNESNEVIGVIWGSNVANRIDERTRLQARRALTSAISIATDVSVFKDEIEFSASSYQPWTWNNGQEDHLPESSHR